jgi:hypothetical protein
MNLFVGFSSNDLQIILRNIEFFKSKMDEIFSNIFIMSFHDDINNGRLMKQWAVFNEKIDKWSKNFFNGEFNGFFPVLNYKEMQKQFEELNELFRQTFQALFKDAFLK